MERKLAVLIVIAAAVHFLGAGTGHGEDRAELRSRAIAHRKSSSALRVRKVQVIPDENATNIIAAPAGKIRVERRMRAEQKIKVGSVRSVSRAIKREDVHRASAAGLVVANKLSVADAIPVGVKGDYAGQAIAVQRAERAVAVQAKIYTDLQEAFRDSEEVYHLDLSGQSFSGFPRGFFDFPNLLSLNLSNMGIDSIPAGISKLKNLTQLDLSSNYFSKFPQGVCKLSNLKRLDLANNDIDYIPDELANLKSLIFLNLDYNKVNELPYAVDSLGGLRTLQVRGNPIPAWQIEEVAAVLPHMAIGR